mgnify:CR=1 FL=1
MDMHDRTVWQKPYEVIHRLGPLEYLTVADIGAGSGYFSFRFIHEAARVIAIDIDPDRNPCCGCVDPWPNHRYCKSGAKSVFEKTELTRCWIDSFERHGFYWLGHDSLEDTMHFEYLGDPDR